MNPKVDHTPVLLRFSSYFLAFQLQFFDFGRLTRNRPKIQLEIFVHFNRNLTINE